MNLDLQATSRLSDLQGRCWVSLRSTQPTDFMHHVFCGFFFAAGNRMLFRISR